MLRLLYIEVVSKINIDEYEEEITALKNSYTSLQRPLAEHVAFKRYLGNGAFAHRKMAYINV